MKISSKQLYSRIKDNIQAEMKERGYKRTKGGMLGWYRPHLNNYIVLWFQCDKWGWQQDWGSKFTIEFQFSDSNEIAVGTISRMRVPYMLGDDDLEIMRERNDSIIKSSEGYKNGGLSTIEVKGVVIPLLGKLLSEQPYNRNFDPWFDYYNVEDIDYWSKFFISRLENFEKAIVEA
jgi:hypothetical protein